LTYQDPDVVSIFYDFITQDSQLQDAVKNDGLIIRMVVDKKVIASTSAGGKGNRVVIITQPRCGDFSWNCGGLAGQVDRYVKIETIIRTIADTDEDNDALALSKAVHQRISEILFPAKWTGKGILMHTEVQDQYPSAPLNTLAYHVLTYRVLCSIGTA
jgi:hypothetical protein